MHPSASPPRHTNGHTCRALTRDEAERLAAVARDAVRRGSEEWSELHEKAIDDAKQLGSEARTLLARELGSVRDGLSEEIDAWAQAQAAARQGVEKLAEETRAASSAK